MTTGSPIRFWAAGLLLCAAACGPATMRTLAQTDQTAQLLGKAHALEVRGRMDMAKQTWQQVLLSDPNNSEALAGMARAAKLEGKNDEAARYLEKMRTLNPSDPNIARVEGMNTQQNTSSELREAGKLSQAGQYARAMTILRQVYGDTPPPGDGALSYYQTEAATDEGRPHAIAGLRALVDKYPQDSRYQIALGKILTYNPRTRAEGRKLLERHPSNPEASEALRQSLVWDSQNPATSGDIRAYLAKHPDQQLASALAQTQAQVQASRRAGGGPRPTTQTPEQAAAAAAFRERSAADQAAYNSLNAKRLDEAETRFKAILANNATDTQALAGLGYVRMQQSNFGGAISYLQQAQNDGSKDPAVEKALRDSRFYYTMQEATAALNENDLVTAQRQFQSALTQRQNDPEALLGLGGTLLKAQQPEPAVPVFTTFVKVKPGDKAAWRGLFMADYGAGRYNDALALDKRVPPPIHAQLLRDPDYLRTLASVYMALGRDADAQRVLRAALELPFPAGAAGLKADVQLQYAALLAAANRRDQAAGLYRQVLAADPKNTNAYAGLIQTEHAAGNDAEALQTLQSMPPENYARAMQEAGFETTVAAIDESQGKYDLAQDVLEKFLTQQAQENHKPFVPAQIQLAGLYLQRGDSEHAYPLYRQIIAANPDRADAWRGLLTALHSTGHDQEALAQIQQMPPQVRRDLENDPAYLQAVGGIYAGLGQPQEAMVFYNRVRQHYAQQHVPPPADIDIQNGWLLYNGQNDAALVPALLALGARPDLTNQQARTVQTIWANLAARRANQAYEAGNPRLALAILNAAAQEFPDNPDVARALAGGYSRSGLSKEAVKIFKAQNLTTASAGDYKSAIGAALADNDLRDAETWLRFGLDQYPHDPQMLRLAGQFEQARGDNSRAAEYYRASLAALPPDNNSSDLAGLLSRVPQSLPARPRSAAPAPSQDLATLLSTPLNNRVTSASQQVTRPFLPGAAGTYGNAPVMMNGASGYGQTGSAQAPTAYTGAGYGAVGPIYATPGYGAPSVDTAPGYNTTTPAKGRTQSGNRLLRDYVPQNQSVPEYPGAPGAPGYPQHPGYPQYPGNLQNTPPPQVGVPQNPGVPSVLPQTQVDAPALPGTPVLQLHPVAAMEKVYGPYVPYDPSVETPAMAQAAALRTPVTDGLRNVVFQQSTTQDGTPIVPYAATAKPATHNKTPSAAAKARAAAIHANQAAAPESMTGVSRPPADSYSVQLDSAQYAPQSAMQVPQPQSSSSSANPERTTQMQPTAPTGGAAGKGSQLYTTSTLQTGSGTQTGVQPPSQTGDSYGQQYPQPNARGGQTASVTPSSGSRRRRKKTPVPVQSPTPDQVPAQPPLTYPTYASPAINPGLPQVASPYPLPPAPTDQDLVMHNIPPLRAYVDTRVDPQAPLTERQLIEQQYATLEGSFSPWLGASVIGRYRSGTPGIDRLTSLEVPFEASIAFANNIRLSVIPKAVFLNSGVLNVAGGGLGTAPILGTLTGAATVNPTQQFVSGVGGEVQLSTSTFSAGVGTTPYQFLVSNVIGRARWRPGNGHFTLFGGRDAVTETQLSYAGLRDPGTANTVTGFGGNVWGGVVQTGGGVRFDSGNEKAGLYLQVEGAQLTGYHVLDNTKFDGTVGAYFRVKVFPGYGTLNVGGTLFGEHYAQNERPETYGLGGYFSPSAYVLAAVPVTFNGHYREKFHYVVNGSVGIQTFQEDSQAYFPLDPVLETSFANGRTAVNSNTGLNYAIDAQGAYQVNEHWYVGGFLTANNTNNYNTITGGFYARYLFRPQYQTVDYPTGLFPIESTVLRPLRVP